MKNFIIVVVILLIIYLVFKKTDNFGVFNNESYFMSRPNCPQLNDDTVCASTPGCRLGNNGCQNNFSALRRYEKPTPEWMKDNFMIVYN